MLISSNPAVNKEFPAETLENCKNSVNYISRSSNLKKVRSNLFQANEVKPTLFEVENPVTGTVYDTFDIRSFTMDTSDKQGLLNSYVSLINPASVISMSADIIQIDTQKVLAVLPSTKTQNNNYLELNDNFQLDADIDPNSVATIVYANWTTPDGKEEELSMLCELNLMDQRLKYEHFRPSIADQGVIIGSPLSLRYDPGIKSNTSDHIVLALYRMPEDMTDVNYVCGFGNGSGGPYIGIPARGTFTMPNDYVPCMTGDYAPKSMCIVGPRQGGGKQAANVIAEYYADQSKMQFSANGSQLLYDMACSWGQIYKEPANWQKSEFDYELKLTLYFQRGTEKPVRYDVHISSVDGDQSAIETIPPLYVMYGCLAEDTLIQMADGSSKRICDIRIGEMVMGIDSEAWLVSNTWSGTEEFLMCVKTEAGKLSLTGNHPLMTRAGIKTANELSEDDLILSGNGEYLRILELYEEFYGGRVYNLDLRRSGQDNAENHLMIAGGLAVGDNVLQNHMEEAVWAL